MVNVADAVCVGECVGVLDGVVEILGVTVTVLVNDNDTVGDGVTVNDAVGVTV